MHLSLSAILLLSQICAPDIAPGTLLSLAHVESRFDPLTIGVNGNSPRSLHPATHAEAIHQAREFIASGANVDLGLAQINSRNLGWLGLSIEDAFDPCRNLAAAATVLAANYAAAARGRDDQAALRVALSLYNTGDPVRGFRNGYVQKVAQAAGYVVPAIAVSPGPAPIRASDPQIADPVMPTRAAPESPTWDVFGRARASGVMVFAVTPDHHGRAMQRRHPKSSGARP
jgi:type IV secretion system protein VirB1